MSFSIYLFPYLDVDYRERDKGFHLKKKTTAAKTYFKKMVLSEARNVQVHSFQFYNAIIFV